MNIFLKNISLTDINLLDKYPINGVIFSITEKNCEHVRGIIEKLPFYIPVIGEIAPLPKYALEEIIFFCRLRGIIITDKSIPEELSCPIILYTDADWNVIVKSKGSYTTDKIMLSQIKEEIPQAIVFTANELIKLWPDILNFWENRMVNR